MRRLTLTLLTALLLGMGGVAASAEIDVMTQNQYLGADLGPVITAAPGELNAEVIKALENVAATLPRERLERLARLVAERSPDVLVLNESFAYYCTNMNRNTPRTEGCGHQSIKGAFVDFLATMESNLAGRYVTKARVRNFAIAGLPFYINNYGAYLSVMDRDVIMVRRDVAGTAKPVPLAGGCPSRSSLEGCNYLAVPTIDTALGPVTVERGYTAVDLAVRGRLYRVFATHLEERQLVPGSPDPDPTRVLQRMQAAELVQTALLFPAAPGTKTLIVGDINSSPVDGVATLPTPIGPLPPPYALIAGSGFTDAWTQRRDDHKGQGALLAGFTCCQAADLANRKSELYERIDMIFSLTPPKKVEDAQLLGLKMTDKTWPPGFGLWPSDHASVAAELEY